VILELYEVPVCGLALEDTTGHQELQAQKQQASEQSSNEKKYVAGAFLIVVVLLIIFWKT
jgi:hypothetical protein